MDDGKPTSPERERTNESLRAERENADNALGAQHCDVQNDADQVVQLARETADAVLVTAREKADEHLDQTSSRAVIEERVLEDAVLRDERAAADQRLQLEREANEAVLSRLVPMEREQTDRYLLTERIRSDADVAHRDDFLGIVSHDLRNLLGGIVLSAELLADGLPVSDESARTLEATTRIQRYAARMNRLIGDLVDVASIDAGRLSVAKRRGDVSALIDEVVDMFRALAVTKGVSLAGHVAERPLPADFDHDRMIQVLANLITNAIKFTESGTIVVRVERTPSGLKVSVQDTGLGIPADKLETVFERYWQIGNDDRRGVGLGLFISRCIVDAHGGTIGAISILGKGSTFSFTLV